MPFRAKIVQTLQGILKRKRLKALLVTSIYNVRYLTGFTGSSGFCIVTPRDALFFTDFRYTEQSEEEVSGWQLKTEKGRRIDVLREELRSLGIDTLGFEASESYEFYELLCRLPVKILSCKGLVESLRISKTKEEIDHIKHAFKRAEDAFTRIKAYIKPGVREIDIALRLEGALKKQGCRRIPFDIIVASGANGSKPHAKATSKRIAKGDFVIIDWGGEYEGYCSDITRTLLMGPANPSEKEEIYGIVNSARERAIKAVAIGTPANRIDAAARDYISSKGQGENFGHGTGHGIGLQPHEEPRINKLNNRPITEGMVFTIEPGIYIREIGGVRIEDTVAVINGKAEVLNKLSTELEVVG